MKFAFIVTGSIFLQSYWVSDNVKLSLAENRVLLCVSRHHHITMSGGFFISCERKKRLQTTSDRQKRTQLLKASSTILVCRGNLISKSAVLRNVKVFSYIRIFFLQYFSSNWMGVNKENMKDCLMTTQISHLLKVRKYQNSLNSIA